MEVEEGRGELEEDERCVEDGPHEQHVYEDVRGVAVVRPVEGEVLLQIEHASPHRHRGDDPNRSNNGS